MKHQLVVVLNEDVEGAVIVVPRVLDLHVRAGGHSTRRLGALGTTAVERVPLPSVVVAGTRRVAVPVAPITVVGVGITLPIGARAGNILSTLARHLGFWIL